MYKPLAAFRDALTNTSKPSQADYIPLSHTPNEKDTPTSERETYIAPTPIPEQPSRLRVIFTVSFHICSALSVTLLNKWALNNIPLPQVLLAFQSGICVLLSVVVKMFGVGNVGHLALPMAEIQKLWVYLFMRTLGVGMKVWCLNLVPAAFYAVARGLLLPVTVLLSFIILRTKATSGIMINIVVICIGFIIGAGSKTSASGASVSPLSLLSDPGFILGVVSTFTTALESIVVKTYGVKMSVYRAVYVTSLAGLIIFSLLSFVSGGTTEFMRLVEATQSSTPVIGANGSPKTFYANIILPILISGSAYYLVSLAAVLQITVTSPTTHTISTAVRGVLQSLLAVMLLPNESLSLEAVISIIFILAGSAGYTWQKEQARQAKEAQTGGKL